MNRFRAVTSQYAREITYFAIWSAIVLLGWIDEGPGRARSVFATGIVFGVALALPAAIETIWRRARLRRRIVINDFGTLALSLIGLTCCSWFVPGGAWLALSLAAVVGVIRLLALALGHRS